MRKHYAIDYASLQPARGLVWEEGREASEFVLPYEEGKPEESEKARLEFIQSLTPLDTLWLEMGPTHRFALAAYRQGAQVRRISSHYTKEGRKKFNLPKNEIRTVLRQLTIEESAKFYSFAEMDAEIAEVGLLAKAYYTVHDIRKRAAQRLAATQNDLFLVSRTGVIDVEQTVQRKLANLVYFAGVLAEQPDRALADMVANQFQLIEDILYSELGRKLNSLPIYQQLFQHITGCGPAISAIIIYYIADIAFFETPAKLKHYAKLHQNPDGSRPCNIVGVQSSWNQRFAQPFWLFAVQTRMFGRPDNVWKQAYLKRVKYESSRTLPEDEEIVKNASTRMLAEVQRRRAMRWIAQKLCVHIHHRWNAVKAGTEYHEPDFECLRGD